MQATPGAEQMQSLQCDNLLCHFSQETQNYYVDGVAVLMALQLMTSSLLKKDKFPTHQKAPRLPFSSLTPTIRIVFQRISQLDH